MRKCAPHFFGLLMVFTWVLSGCDSERNVENPDIHYFVKYYGGDGDQSGVDMQVLGDGSFILLGNYSKNSNDTDLYLLRVSSEGEVIWSMRHGEDQENAVWAARDIEPTNDGNFIVLADYRPSGTNTTTDFSLLKFSPDGDLLDEVLVTHSLANEYTQTVTPLSDGGFIVSGSTELTATFPIVGHPDPDLGDILNYRFNASLDIDPTWGPRTSGFGSHLDVSVKTVQMNDTTFYSYGHTNSDIAGVNPDGRFGLFYFHRNGSGTTGSNRYVPNIEANSNMELKFVEVLPAPLGAGVVLIGSSTDDFGLSKLFLARMRSTLTFSQQDASFSTIVPLNRNVRASAVTSAMAFEAGYLVLGNEIRSTGASNIWLSKIDQSGTVLWSTSLGAETENDMGAVARELPDGRIVVLGTVGLADNQFKMAFYKLNRSGAFLR